MPATKTATAEAIHATLLPLIGQTVTIARTVRWDQAFIELPGDETGITYTPVNQVDTGELTRVERVCNTVYAYLDWSACGVSIRGDIDAIGCPGNPYSVEVVDVPAASDFALTV